MAHDERRLEVLRAIVQDYVSTNDPVGSKALAERHDLGVSPATIRNDMAVLEEQGYITQPHTSAGRVPTDKGYRLFVDRLSAVKPLSVAERRAIERFLDGAVDLHDVLSPHRPAAGPAHPAGRRRPVPDALAQRRAPPRGRPAGRRPADAGADHRHRPGRAARRRHPGRHRRRGRRRAAHAAQLRVRRRQARRRRQQGARPARRPPRRTCAAWSATVSATLLETLVEPGEDRLVIGGTANLARGSALDFPGTRAAAAGGAGRTGGRPAVDESRWTRAPCSSGSARRTPTRR